MEIKADRVVRMDYELKDDEGTLLDKSREGAPLAYLHGHKNIIPGLEQGLEGESAGTEKAVTVAAADAYGEYKPELRQEIDRSMFPEGTPIEVGMRFRAGTPEGGQVIVRVTEIADDKVIVDANHELAGRNLNFKVKVRDVREATKEELEHGHAHGDGGVQH